MNTIGANRDCLGLSADITTHLIGGVSESPELIVERLERVVEGD
jgi:hypothetical protein